MKCPGQDNQYWQADAIFDVKCPECCQKVEFFKDNTLRKCTHCGHRLHGLVTKTTEGFE